jgi:hypothetical protein
LNSQILEVPRHIIPPVGGLLSGAELLAPVLMDAIHPDRAAAEDFVRETFARSYGAELSSFYPLLLGIRACTGEYAAVTGVRPAGGQPLFLEHYLDAPIDTILGVERNRIVEIGNLSPAGAGQARWLICLISSFLTGAGFFNVVFTAVPRLSNAFRRMGLPLIRLGEARAERLPAGAADGWGSYYESGPAVFGGDLGLGFRAFGPVVETRPDLREIARQAYALGRAFATPRDPADNEFDYPGA